MKTYLLKRLRHFLGVLAGVLVAILLTLMVTQKKSLDSNKIDLLIWIGIAFVISEVVLFFHWFLKKDKN